jgi:SAM-dependent methyltransferase
MPVQARLAAIRFLEPLELIMQHADANTMEKRFEFGDDFGIGATLSQGFADLRAAANQLDKYSSTNVASIKGPFYFDSRKLCIAAYSLALSRVRERFWTTTFLSSGFWAGEDDDILMANFRLMEGLRKSGVATRRLFLISVSLEEEVRRWRDERISLLKCNDVEGISLLDARFTNLFKNLDRLAAQGCDLRVVHDRDGLHNFLPAALNFDHRDSELALYDDWRFDIFSGGRTGTIASVTCFTPVMADFQEYREQLTHYFESLWRKAQPISVLVERIRHMIESVSARINYVPVWLARYDYGLPEEDKLLKIVEMSSVKTQLKQLHRWGKIERYLDVGTCTGRYPINLRNAVVDRGEIIGIDNDLDCVRFARWNIEQECRGDARIRIEHKDFCAEEIGLKGPFGLVTCMLGTLLHFTRDASAAPPYKDPLQAALERFVGLLSQGGLLFFSVWSDQASEGGGLLSIYSEEDKQRLAKWIPSESELQDRLRAAGLEFGPPVKLEDRMDLYCCWSGGEGSPGNSM